MLVQACSSRLQIAKRMPMHVVAGQVALVTAPSVAVPSCIISVRRLYMTSGSSSSFASRGQSGGPEVPAPLSFDGDTLFASLAVDSGASPVVWEEEEEEITAAADVVSDAVTDAQELEVLTAHETEDEECDALLVCPELPERSKGNDNRRKPQDLVSVTPVSETCVAVMSCASSYISRQDALYLAVPTPKEAQLPRAEVLGLSPCVMVVFAANDMRVHDNYALALATVRAEAAGRLPLVAVAVIDYRTFAQPSAIGGFFRQSPMRARFFLETLANLREMLERELQIPLLIRCGRPEEHIPRLALECGATDVFFTTQYAPHEKRVHDAVMKALKYRYWMSRDAASGSVVTRHDAAVLHPYGDFNCSKNNMVAAVPHSVWQTTLVHVDDLPVPVSAMAEGERWYHDDVSVANIRPTKPFDPNMVRLKSLPTRHDLLPSAEELSGLEPPPAYRGSIPTLSQLGYASPEAFTVEEVIATQSSHPPGEQAAFTAVENWLAEGGTTSLLRHGRERRTNTKMYSQRLSRLSPYLSNGSLSPRRLYEMLRRHTNENLRDNFVQMQYREALLRLSRRDYWHWMGLRYGDRLFYSYGPRPEQTDGIPDWRHETKIVQKWCLGLTGVPFADAAMRELLATGFVAQEGRQALAWLLTRGYGQDWRLGAEWLERCSLDYDPFLCYGNFAYFSELIRDDFGEPVRNVHWLAHHHDQSGIYVKKWLPVLSKIPPVYIHRPHVLTARMQAMHGIRLGKNYPYPLKLWDGAQHTLSGEELTAYFHDTSSWQHMAKNGAGGPGYAEAVRHGCAIMKVHEWNLAMSPDCVSDRPWAHHLPASAFESDEDQLELVDVDRTRHQHQQQEQTQNQAWG